MKIKCLGWDVLTFKLLLLLCCTVCADATTPLWLLFVDSSCGGEGFEASIVLPAAEMAVERVNSNSSLLQGYSLNLSVTQVCRHKLQWHAAMAKNCAVISLA